MEPGYDKQKRWNPRRAVELLGTVCLSGIVVMGCSHAEKTSDGEQVLVCDRAGENQGKVVVIDSKEADSHPEEYSRNLDDCLPPLTPTTEPSAELQPSR